MAKEKPKIQVGLRPPSPEPTEIAAWINSGSDTRTSECLNVQTSKHSKIVVRKRDGRQLKRTTVYFEPDLHTRLSRFCFERSLEHSRVVADALKAWLDAKE